MPTKRPVTTAGFTIIEVLIVLAIAGLIMLIVFQAIPTLERSGRNNQRKQDISLILEAVSHYELNNSGNIPKTNVLRNDLQNSSHKLTYYLPANISVASIIFDTTAPISPNANNIDQVQIYNHAKCDPSSPGDATEAGAGYNDVVALFALETGGASQIFQCQQL